ncbi:peptidase S8/S53 subtilisin kexin sedolisin [Glycocaulis alkaliphilus]|uniref:Peptidase S8/S53 subtilisin kexin sedolisin n=1 Tax=Glycocaulis alkaliphilus TaxID=1434191 RepID=A0A3T0E8P1_9PROT|nr:peptidase S8/S53 subtilisin kexin sedolisin [Glycocaulis alkaliphilus]
MDSGINQSHPEFHRRISSASTDIVSSRGELEDIDGHGTGVAGVIVANKNNQGGHGVAFESIVLAIRADTPGTCEDDDPDDGGCRFSDANIAASIDYAISHNARVINLSLGRDIGSNDSLTQTFAAMRRAVNAGIFIVVSAGNSGEETDGTGDQPNFPANFANMPDAQGFVVAVGAVQCPDGGENCAPGETVITSFSNRAGNAGETFLMAPGRRILTPFLDDDDGDPRLVLYSGTSFAAPHVAGALALLLDAFPNLQGNDALQILFDTALDLGAPGTDSIYGRGLIDLAAAFQPVGATSMRLGTGEAIPLDLLLSAPDGPAGDWLWESGLVDDAVLRDSYRRPFHFSADRPSFAPDSALNAMESAAAAGLARASRTQVGPASINLRMNWQPPHLLRNLPQDWYQSAPDMSFAFRQGGLSVEAGRGFSSPAPVGGAGVSVLSETLFSGAVARFAGSREWVAASYEFGPAAFHMRSSSGDNSAFNAVGFTYTLRSGRLTGQTVGLETGTGQETGSVMGGRLAARFGAEDAADTQFTAALWSGQLPLGWRGSARAEYVTGQFNTPASLTVEQELGASAWSAGIDRPLAGGRFGFTLSQPLRMEHGRISARVPVNVDREDRVSYERRHASLTPSGREISLEAAWRKQLTTQVDAAFAARVTREPGHIADAEPQALGWASIRARW